MEVVAWLSVGAPLVFGAPGVGEAIVALLSRRRQLY